MALPSSSIALLSRLRRNSRLLLSDLSRARFTDYPSLWNFYIDCLGHNEPAIRSFCLKCLRMLSASIASTLLELPKQIRLVKLLCDILSGDEVPLHRALAAVVLGHCVPFMVQTRFPQKILRYAFSLLLSQFLRVFPSNYSTLETDVKERFLKSSDTNRKTLEYNLSFIRALGCFFITEPAQDTAFVNYIDSLFSNLLSVTVHELYTAEILRALCVGLPITSRNLMRIKQFYLHQLHEITSIISQSHSEGAPVKETVLSSTAAYLREQMTIFLSKWYVEYGNQNTMGLGFPKDTHVKVEDSLAKIKTTTPVMSLKERLNEYRAFVFTEFSLSDQVKKDDTAIDIVADLAIRDHVDDVKSTIQSKPILSFSTAHISTLTFHRLPYKKEVHIHNKSMVNDVPFRAEVFPSQFFKVYPASGIVPKSKSYTVFVTFLPQPRMLLPSSEVDGSISLRSESGSLINRMPLRAINPPSVWCSTNSLDFGCCPVGEIRSLYVYIKNLSSIDCNCCVTVSHKSASSHPSFRVTPSQAILQPFEKRVLTVQFMPLLEESVEEEITVISDTGEYHSINMSGIAKSMLAVGDTKLDFGLTDLHHYLTPGSRPVRQPQNLSSTTIIQLFCIPMRNAAFPFSFLQPC
ncbi:hypothetical protein BKA69DRAFT_678305 [Paraphysoderma sedebokerense]|nr:hypothetical protein BKA69DRAFT_678305 [Paraphysoderma sedebokerense]